MDLIDRTIVIWTGLMLMMFMLVLHGETLGFVPFVFLIVGINVLNFYKIKKENDSK